MESLDVTVDLTSVSTDTLEQVLGASTTRVAAEYALQMRVLQEIDRRQVPAGDGCHSLAEWVTARLDVTPDFSRRLVQTGRRLTQLPHLSKTLEAGEVTLDRAEQIAKVATPENEHGLLEESRGLDLPGTGPAGGPAPAPHPRPGTRNSRRSGLGDPTLPRRHPIPNVGAYARRPT